MQVDWLYYVSFLIVVVGIITYSKTEKDPPPLPVIEDDDPNVEYQALNEDNAIWRDNASAS